MTADERSRLLEALRVRWLSERWGDPLPGDIATAVAEYERCRRYLQERPF